MFNFCLFVNKARKSASKQSKKECRKRDTSVLTVKKPFSTFHRHKQLYYDSRHHQWIKSDVRDSSEDDVEAGDDGGEVLEFDSDHSLAF